MVRDPETATFAKTPEEAADRWRQRVKFDLLKETADKVPDGRSDQEAHQALRQHSQELAANRRR